MLDLFNKLNKDRLIESLGKVTEFVMLMWVLVLVLLDPF